MGSNSNEPELDTNSNPIKNNLLEILEGKILAIVLL